MRRLETGSSLTLQKDENRRCSDPVPYSWKQGFNSKSGFYFQKGFLPNQKSTINCSGGEADREPFHPQISLKCVEMRSNSVKTRSMIVIVMLMQAKERNNSGCLTWSKLRNENGLSCGIDFLLSIELNELHLIWHLGALASWCQVSIRADVSLFQSLLQTLKMIGFDGTVVPQDLHSVTSHLSLHFVKMSLYLR